ncbi:MAG: U32 family peptidase [Lachnospiraceae bacterium]|nr:U32 family peptidase [Lachnospiraceae bacterium]
MDMELLAPAGSPEILKCVINAGADAVYVGGDKFGARAYAANFSQEDLLWAIDYVHLCGKKMYLTVNTLLKNKEIETELYDYILPLYQAGLDAVLVQDFGVLSFLHSHFPQLPLHASTQLTVSSKESAMYLKSLGVERVVVSRELSLKEMKEIHDEVGVELEAFVHGALCYSYSGMCLFSSILGGRSGNRGRCAQPCRMAYDVSDSDGIIKKNTYILSLKDACNYEKIKEMYEAGIYSLKIEGRMKQAEYAYGVTKLYANKLAGKESANALQQLKDYGNRGGFTTSYLYKQNDASMITYSDASLHKANELPAADTSEKRFLADGYLYLKKDEEAIFTLVYGNASVTVKGNVVDAAKNKPLQEEDVVLRMKKTGNLSFDFDSLTVEMDDDIFVPNGALNNLKREGIEALKNEILSAFRRPVATVKPKSDFTIQNIKVKEPVFIGSIYNRNQLKAVIDSELLQMIYLNLSTYSKQTMIEDLRTDINAIVNAHKKCYLILPAIIRNKDAQYIQELAPALKELPIQGFVAQNLDAFALCKRLFFDYEIIGDHGLYSFNNEAVSFLRAQNATRLTAPLELNRTEIAHRDNHHSEFILYGRYPLMQSANCICNSSKGCTHQPQFMTLTDRYQAKFPVLNQCSFCFNTIFNSLPTNLIGKMDELKEMGFEYYRLVFTTETQSNIQKILRELQETNMGHWKYNSNKEYTNGHYKRGVE